MTSSGGNLFHNTAPFLLLKARTLYAAIGAWLWNIRLTFGIATDCMPQPRYAEQTNSFKYLVVHGHVHQCSSNVSDGFGRVGGETIEMWC